MHLYLFQNQSKKPSVLPLCKSLNLNYVFTLSSCKTHFKWNLDGQVLGFERQRRMGESM